MKAALVVVAALAIAPAARAQLASAQPVALTQAERITYAAHDGVTRPVIGATPARTPVV